MHLSLSVGQETGMRVLVEGREKTKTKKGAGERESTMLEQSFPSLVALRLLLLSVLLQQLLLFSLSLSLGREC